jgi:hypothetical protein
MPPSQKTCLNSDMPKNIHGVVSLTNIYLTLKDDVEEAGNLAISWQEMLSRDILEHDTSEI